MVLLPSLLFAEVTSWIYSIIQGPKHVLSKLKANFWVIWNLRAILAARRDTQKLRRVNDHVILSKLDYRLDLTQTARPEIARILEKVTSPILRVFAKFGSIGSW
jgi:hypothetical protein